MAFSNSISFAFNHNKFKYLAFITPIFIYYLLNYISGVNLLEERAKEKWGKDPEYVKYLKTTPKFFPKIF